MVSQPHFSKVLQLDRLAIWKDLGTLGAGWKMLTEIHQFLTKHMAVCQNPIPLVNIKIAGKWMFIPLKMVCIGIDP